ncbi:hypothetical protein [Wolbachia endosymbiont (group A) of Myopa testacea]|uniref:hypothetical protein n=1 Tax=Wolbachia endosymbiont (group A) of Myopa testacea TaxID=3066148 RepID=UPI0033401166
MRNIFNKTNVPYLAVGALATLTLLASGVFAVAPYIGFLAPVAALSVGLPFIIGCAVFSVVTIALSYKAISKNKTISEKDVQLSEKEKEISEKDAKLVDQAKEIEELKRGNAFVLQEMKDIQTASEKEFTSTKEAFISGRVTRIVKDGLKDVYGAMPSTESAKETLIGIGNKLKNVCGTSVGYTMGTLELAKKTLGSIGGSTKEEKNVATENLSGLKVVALPYVATNTTIQKDPKISSPESQPTKEENGQGWFAWSLGKAKSVMTEVVVVGADVTKPYFAKITKALAPNLNM